MQIINCHKKQFGYMAVKVGDIAIACSGGPWGMYKKKWLIGKITKVDDKAWANWNFKHKFDCSIHLPYIRYLIRFEKSANEKHSR